MRQLTAALGAMAIFAAACGSDTTDVLRDLGLSPTEADCFSSEYEARNLDIDRVLRADEGELSEDEQRAVIDVADTCVGADTNHADDDTGTSNDTGDVDTSDTNDADEPDTNNGDLTYESLSLFERAFADGMIDQGATPEAAVCIIREFGAGGISLLEFVNIDPADGPTDEMLSAILLCGDDLLDAGAFDFSNSDPITDGFTYGDDPEMDLLWDLCEFGDGEACDELFFVSPVGSDYEEFGDTCGFRFESATVLCADELGTSTGGTAYGDDPLLDGLYDDCRAGNMPSCDTLYFDSPVDSEYENYGSTCGGVEVDTYGGCATDPMFYGDDTYFDGLYDSCEAGEMTACDELYLFSAVDSEYETFGNLCGGLATEEEFGNCEAVYG